jgi:cell division protein FtsA
LAGTRLGGDLHAVSADDAPLRNLAHVIERAYLTVAGVVPAPYASGIAASSEEERREGVLCIDIGAGTTALSMFCAGHLLAVEVIPVGGNHLTSDLARAMTIPLAEAERIKTLYGRVGALRPNEQEVESATPGQEMPGGQTAAAHVAEVLATRLTGLFGQIAEKVERFGSMQHAVRRIVLAGGTSLLPGLSEFATECFARPVRVAQIRLPTGMPLNLSSPAFATAVGLIEVGLDPSVAMHWRPGGMERRGYLRRMGAWLRESF